MSSLEYLSQSICLAVIMSVTALSAANCLIGYGCFMISPMSVIGNIIGQRPMSPGRIFLGILDGPLFWSSCGCSLFVLSRPLNLGTSNLRHTWSIISLKWVQRPNSKGNMPRSKFKMVGHGHKVKNLGNVNVSIFSLISESGPMLLSWILKTKVIHQGHNVKVKHGDWSVLFWLMVGSTVAWAVLNKTASWLAFIWGTSSPFWTVCKAITNWIFHLFPSNQKSITIPKFIFPMAIRDAITNRFSFQISAMSESTTNPQIHLPNSDNLICHHIPHNTTQHLGISILNLGSLSWDLWKRSTLCNSDLDWVIPLCAQILLVHVAFAVLFGMFEHVVKIGKMNLVFDNLTHWPNGVEEPQSLSI